MELFVYDASWRLLERRTDETWNDTSFVHDSTSQWVWGQRYIDELVASITDGDANDEFEDLFYAMTDRNFSVIGLSQSTGASGERIRYDAYGHAQALPRGDANGDGSVNLDDQDIVLANFGKQIGDTSGTATYRVEADFDSNGAIDLDDLNTVFNNFGQSIERGRLSGSGNIVGYAGYIFEPATGMYVVRHRWYSTENGRWLSRDPMEYIDGQSTYEYVASNPTQHTDPTGEAIPAVVIVVGGAIIVRVGIRVVGNAIKKSISKKARERLRVAGICKGIHTAYDKLNCTGCKKVKPKCCDTAMARQLCLAEEVYLRRKYLRNNCDYFLKGSVTGKGGSAGAEAGHRTELLQKQTALATFFEAVIRLCNPAP